MIKFQYFRLSVEKKDFQCLKQVVCETLEQLDAFSPFQQLVKVI